jgi:hypothetical protein
MTPSVPNPASGLPRRSRVLALAFLAALAPAIFALSTNNIWEDFFITYRCSLNLAEGHGLVYEVGRTVHVFTSPLGTLLPAGISWLLRTGDPQAVIDVFRLCACIALGGAWWLAAGRMGQPVALGLTAGLWLLDVKLAAFSTNGMETAFLVLFVVLAWRAIVDGDMRLAGIAFGGAMWTRPDGFVFIGALAAATWLLQRERRRDWAGWARMVGWGAAIYAPWFIWAWWYYGSPVPHTILAKRTIVADWNVLTALATWPIHLLFGRTAADDAFLPPYFYFGGWPGWLWVWSKAITLTAVIAAVWPRCARPARIAGLAFLFGGLYLEITPRAPWYFPAWQVLAYIALGGVAAALVEGWAGASRLGRIGLAVAAAALVLTQAAVFLAVSVQLREQQQLIESGLRTTIGRDLRRLAASPKDTVFLEPLGYIGFYSGLAMRDTPGLCAPEVVALRRAGQTTMGELALALKPDWVVLRAGEFKAMTAGERTRFDQLFDYAGDYDVRRQVETVEFLPGRNFLRYDAHFLLWHRRKTGSDRPKAQ